MRYVFSVFFVVLGSLATAQQLKQGLLVDAQSDEIVAQAHIQNLSQKKFTVSNFDGMFQLPMALGDSIWVSCVGYKSTGFIVGPRWMGDSIVKIELQQDSILLDEVRVAELPTESTFKRLILESEPEDTTLRLTGMGMVFPKEADPAQGVSVNMGSAFNKLYKKISKAEKEKAKYQQIVQNNEKIARAEEMFNRDFVGQITDLQGNELTDFMSFCSFTPDYITGLTEYQLAEVILEKVAEYKKSMES
jgi:hypothetical protein